MYKTILALVLASFTCHERGVAHQYHSCPSGPQMTQCTLQITLRGVTVAVYILEEMAHAGEGGARPENTRYTKEQQIH